MYVNYMYNCIAYNFYIFNDLGIPMSYMLIKNECVKKYHYIHFFAKYNYDYL